MSEWQNRLGTVRVLALGVVLVVFGIIWFVRHWSDHPDRLGSVSSGQSSCARAG
jgi:hypothetical protein